MPAVAFALAIASPAGAAPPLIQRHTSPNGLEVLVVENHAVPVVTIEVAAKNGSMTEPPEFNGLSHLYEHMFFKANAVIPSQEAWLSRVHELGLTWNGTTNTERVNYFFTTTTVHAHDAMVFMRDAILSPLFDPKELERERVVVTGEIDRNEASPWYHFSHQLDQRVWFRYPSRKDPLGNRKTVLKATPEMMRTIQKRYYVPNNSVLAVTGDVVAADVFREADALYQGWKRTDDPFKKYPLVKHPPLPKSEALVVVQPVRTYTGNIIWHGPSTVGDDVDLTYAADLLTSALSQPSSKFIQHVVDSGACVSVHLNWYTQMNTGPVTLRFEAAPDRIDRCVKAALDELGEIEKPGYFTDEELANAAHLIEVSTITQRERPSEYAHALTFWWTSASLDYYLGYVDHVKKVRREDVARYLDKYVLKKPFVFGSLVSPEMQKSGFDQAHFEALAGIVATKGGAH